ncbi:hypothetical protein SETIT_5G164600v2 [Setaria italica]|uniref:EGF-like domain-containing protein n=1 Tax=Setaria italica TaxID=4555 RepID=K3XQ94_SETIT|nr:hypothetical protein SETIT_5G164600v2 [Setaria italica]
MASLLLLGVAVLLYLASISAQAGPGCQIHCGDKKASKSMSRGKTRVLYNTSTYCYDPNTRRMERDLWWLDFSTWPYRFSNLDNNFIVLGCNTLAYIYNKYNRAVYTTACASVCERRRTLTNGSCLGVGCCQNTNAIRKGLRRYDVYFYQVYNDSDSWQFNPCSYAAQGETESFSFSSNYITTKRFNETYQGRQPMVLNWAIGNVTCELARNMSSYACRHRNTECVDSTNGPGYLCNCTKGYEGNPSLLYVDECKQNPKACPNGAACDNIEGGYHCSCPPGRKLNKNTNSCNPDTNLKYLRGSKIVLNTHGRRGGPKK